MRIVFIINNIFEIDSSRGTKIFEEFLIKNISDPANLFDACFCLGTVIYKIGRNRNRKFASKLFPLETYAKNLYYNVFVYNPEALGLKNETCSVKVSSEEPSYKI